jgi:hypothetical protein
MTKQPGKKIKIVQHLLPCAFAILCCYACVQNVQAQSAYKGGIGRGDAALFLPLSTLEGNIPPSIYRGGTGRGDFNANITMLVISGDAIPNIYKGGVGRGDNASEILKDIFSFCNEIIVWSGAINTAWENPANWFCGVVPGPQHKVIIPEGRPRYPVINGTVNISRLDVQPNAMVSLQQNAQLFIVVTEQ